MINGDDNSFRSTRIGYEAWRHIAAFAGLKESVGKTYFSRDFVEINSTQFLRVEPKPKTVTGKTGRLVTRLVPFAITPYVNMGLMTGLKRSGLNIGLNDQNDPRNNIGVRYRELLRLCPEALREEVHKRFINHHRELLRRTRLPWYVPEWLGGMGLTGLREPSELDRRIAQHILFNWKKHHPVSLAHQEAPWKTWEIASRRVPVPQWVRRKNAGVDEYTSVVATKCIDLLFDSRVELSDLFENREAHSRTVTAIGRNARLWRVPKGPLPPPMPLDDMLYRPVYASYQPEALPPAHAPSPQPLD